MTIAVTCPTGHLLRLKDKYAGLSGFCPHCSARVDVLKLRLLVTGRFQHRHELAEERRVVVPGPRSNQVALSDDRLVDVRTAALLHIQAHLATVVQVFPLMMPAALTISMPWHVTPIGLPAAKIFRVICSRSLS